MSDEFAVDLDHLDQVVARLTGLAGFINDHLDEIDDKVATLAGTGWESVAATAYEVAHRQWAGSAREFTEGVQDMSDAAKAAHTAYSDATDANTKMMRGA
ncbi:WXG100 family type VII secretion target [Nocardia fluminea]|jgi:WXG100 family type VII secretion target|uniref:ESAT-6-like protein n=1 Tax=Nocardia fluminea TaxID=134984 RepID=A0A2N3VCR4_9NOCA|nr:WXG100 family type VII secretion target [Nocardia fluminea]PKV79376.1 WXG100 family type VII secretion target [Nocardia fluminea]